MIRRRLIIVTALAFVLLPVVAGCFVLYTEAGARWVLGMARDATDGALDWQSLDGSIAGGLAVDGLTFTGDGVSLAVDEIAATASLSLFPPGVVLPAAEARNLGISLDTAGARDGAETDVAALLESLELPLPIHVESLRLANINVDKAGDQLVGLTELRLELDWDETLSLRSVVIDGGEPLAASGYASLGLRPPFKVEADVEARADTTITRLPVPIDARVELGGSLDSLQVSLSESLSSLEMNGRLTSLSDVPGWDLTATVAGFVLDAATGVGIRDARLQTAGTINAYRLQAELDATGLVDQGPVRVDARASGNLEGLDIEMLELKHATARLGARGRLDFPALFAGRVEVHELKLEQWLPGLDEAHVLTGQVDAAVTTESLSLRDGRFQVDGTNFGIDVGGTIDLAARSVDARLAWQALDWPLGGAPRIQSRSGEAHITGTLDAWSARFSAALAAPDIAEGRFAAIGRGTRSAAELEILEGEVLGGAIDGSARLDWENEFDWSGEVIVRGLRTAAVLPAYPGVLTTRLRAAGSASGSGVDLEILDLRGTILDETLSGSGSLSLAGRRLTARKLRVSHGAARLALDGSLLAGSGLAFELAVPDLALYRRDFAGDLDIEGRVSLQDEAPALALAASSRALRAGGLAIDGLRVTTRDNESGGIDLALDANEVLYGTRRVEDVDLDAVINPEQQRIKMTMTPLGNRVTIAAEGSMSEPGTLSGFPWNGTLQEFTLITRDGEGGGIERPVPLEIAPDRFRIEDLCMSGEQRGELCATIGFDAADGLAVDGDIDGVPLDVLNAFLQTGFDFEQTVSGSLRWDSQAAGGASGKVDLRFTPGLLKSSRFPGLDLLTGEGELAFEVVDGDLLSARIALPMGADGYIEGDFNVDDLGQGVDSPIDGALSASTRDIDVFAVLLPDIDEAKGYLEADLAIGGTVGQPLVTGTASLRNGEMNYFPLGTVLTDIEVDGRFDENRHIDLSGTFLAGDGRGEITTRTSGDAGERPGIHVRIRGDALKVVDLPDITAVANADIAVDYRSRRVDIDGAVDIPYARIRPVNLVAARVDESSDVVIVAGTLPDVAAEGERPSPLSIHGNLSLGVGDDVQVILDLARASIDGNADLKWAGDPLPNGLGRYNINGTVQAFGQVLNISEGQIRFPDVPANEPLLNIRATREIFGNTQIKEAGVLVQGPARRPTIEAYTYPITTEERALTLLVTGNDFDYQQGVGAIDFGTYIAPRLFLSYGIGVFDRENIVTARYDLTTGFGIRTTSGSRESGVDVTYRLER